jgi:hypothetical protein
MKPQTYQLNANGPERAGVTQRAHDFIDRLPADKSWVITVQPYVKKRSLDQNAATFGLAYKIIMEATGLEGDAERKQLHRDFCGDFFGWTDGAMGHRRPVRTTTTNEAGERDVVDTVTMARMYDFIQRTAAGYGIDIPSPDPMWSQRERLAA